TFCTDHWRCRFLGESNKASHRQIAALLQRASDAGIDFIKTENLCYFDGQRAYSQEGE
ncbi:MAG: NADP-dependent isocitrate dehydrogenase, partial [Bryobacteraceae bacterium]